jgi:hypothetical protein
LCRYDEDGNEVGDNAPALGEKTNAPPPAKPAAAAAASAKAAPAAKVKGADQAPAVGGCTSCIRLTHSLQPPGSNP